MQRHFSDLRMIGQFNKGFIICKWKQDDGRYFVVDQHAADEKYNYERLQRDVKVSIQTLIKPMVVEVSLSQLMAVEENLQIFVDNGFMLNLVNRPADNVYEVYIVGVPNMFFWQYNRQDFLDLLYLVMNHARYLDDLMVPKAKRELATKACRQSSKIGDSLDLLSMRQIVGQLKGLKHPWNCPHGRPSTIIAENIKEPKIDRKAILKTLQFSI